MYIVLPVQEYAKLLVLSEGDWRVLSVRRCLHANQRACQSGRWYNKRYLNNGKSM